MTIPRWKSALTRALGQDQKSIVFQLATTDTTTHNPHVRSHVFRTFLSPAAAPAISLVVSSTDIRTPKVSQIAANRHVELAWWIEGTQEQFRVSGIAYVVPAPSHRHSISEADVSASPALSALNSEGFDWEAKRREVFDAMSANMKAAWCRPSPGARLEGGYEEARDWPQTLPKLGAVGNTEKEERDLEVALGNFALVVIEPSEVDYVELGVRPNRRTWFVRNASGEWSEETVVP